MIKELATNNLSAKVSGCSNSAHSVKKHSAEIIIRKINNYMPCSNGNGIAVIMVKRNDMILGWTERYYCESCFRSMMIQSNAFTAGVLAYLALD